MVGAFDILISDNDKKAAGEKRNEESELIASI